MPHLVASSARHPSYVTSIVFGSFTDPTTPQLLLVLGGQVLELTSAVRSDSLRLIVRQSIDGSIVCVRSFRASEHSQHHVALTTQSGCLVVLAYDTREQRFLPVVCEPFAKPQLSRTIPGHHICVDEGGESILLCGLEATKLVYFTGSDPASGILTISGHSESRSPNLVTIGIVGIDGAGYPVFVAAEFTGTLSISAYEVDMSLKMLVRRELHTESSDQVPSLLASFRGGCLAFFEDFVQYYSLDGSLLESAIPRRLDASSKRGVIVTSFESFSESGLALTELGDLFRIELYRSELSVTLMFCNFGIGSIHRLPSDELLLLSNGPNGTRMRRMGKELVYEQVERMRTKEIPEIRCSSAATSGRFAVASYCPTSTNQLDKSLLRELERPASLAPLRGWVCSYLHGSLTTTEDELRLLSGNKILSDFASNWMKPSVLASTDLPGRPSGVWYLPPAVIPDSGKASEVSAYILLSFADSTTLLQVAEDIDEVQSGVPIVSTSMTVCASALRGDVGLVQVTPKCFRVILATKVAEIQAPAGKSITAACCNGAQLMICISQVELVYYELDVGNAMVEITRRLMPSPVEAVCIMPTGHSLRSDLAAVALSDRTVRILSTVQGQTLKQTAMMSLEAGTAASLAINSFGPQSVLFIGTTAGTLVQSAVDRITGSLSNPSTVPMGNRVVQVANVELGKTIVMGEITCVVTRKSGSSSRAAAGGLSMKELDLPALDHCDFFKSDQCPSGGLMYTSSAALGIAHLSDSTESEALVARRSLEFPFSVTKAIALPAVQPTSSADRVEGGVSGTQAPTGFSRGSCIVAVSQETNRYTEATKSELAAVLSIDPEQTSNTFSIAEKNRTVSAWSVARTGAAGGEVDISHNHLAQDESVTSLCVCRFMQLRENRPTLVLALARNTSPPFQAESASLRVYIYDENFSMKLAHSTPLYRDGALPKVTTSYGVPLAVCEFNLRLAVSVAASAADDNVGIIRIYELGKQALLKKHEYRNIYCKAMYILRWVSDGNERSTPKDRLFAADISNGVIVLEVHETLQQLYVIACDSVPRWVTCMEVLDFCTAAVGDKYNALTVLRIPESRLASNADYGLKDLQGIHGEYIAGHSPKLEAIASFHIGQTPSGILVRSGTLIVSTLLGGIYAFKAVASRSEYDLLSRLEGALRSRVTPISGLSHLRWRGYYTPVRAVVDGDLLESIGELSEDAQREISALLASTPDELRRVVSDMRVDFSKSS